LVVQRGPLRTGRRLHATPKKCLQQPPHTTTTENLPTNVVQITIPMITIVIRVKKIILLKLDVVSKRNTNLQNQKKYRKTQIETNRSYLFNNTIFTKNNFKKMRSNNNLILKLKLR
jgi:hypothetical protein